MVSIVPPTPRVTGKDKKSTEQSIATMQKTMRWTDSIQPDLDEQVMQLASEMRELKKDVMILMEKVDWLIESNRAIQKVVVTDTDDEQIPDNFDMTQDQIKELILREVSVGESFYPSDIAVKHGLDFDAVLEVVDRLRSEGRMETSADAKDAE